MQGDKDVSIILPCRNEERFIARCLDSILANDFPKERLEIIVVDGMSQDGTVKIVAKYVEAFPYISIVENPEWVVPAALNIGIRKARGDFIIRMDSHTEFDRSYISNCIKYLSEGKAENVGGPIESVAGNNTLLAEAIALASSDFFGVGNSRFRISNKPQYVDTVPFGAWGKILFDEIGLFDERLVRGQDIEFNARIRKNRGKIFLSPDIKSYYHCPSTLLELWVKHFKNGQWNIYTLAVSTQSLSWRHFVPLLFVFSIIIASLVSLFFSPRGGAAFLVLLIGSYLMLSLLFSLKTAAKKGFKYFLLLPLIFATMHLSYGLGSLWGLLTLWKWKKKVNRA